MCGLFLSFLLPHSFPPLLIQGPSRNSRDGMILTIARRSDADARRAAADRVLEAHEALKGTFNHEMFSADYEKHRRRYLELLPPSSGPGRPKNKPGEELLHPRAKLAASQAAVAKIFNTPMKDVRAARQRQASRAADPLAATRRREQAVGTHEERLELANFVKSMAQEHMAQPRQAVTSLLKEMLAHRRGVLQMMAVTPTPKTVSRPSPITPAELAIIEGSRGLSKEWFLRWELEYGVAPVSKASLQSEMRALAFTKSACTDHFARLEDALAEMDFLVTSGPYKGQIKREGECCGVKGIRQGRQRDACSRHLRSIAHQCWTRSSPSMKCRASKQASLGASTVRRAPPKTAL